MIKPVMYHYVQKYDDRLHSLYYLHKDNFEKQLDFFESRWGVITRSEWEDALSGGKIGEKVLLTFDDSLKCHYEYVASILKHRKMFGIFYVPTAPYTAGKTLMVHKVHQILASIPADQIYDTMRKLISPNELISNHDNIFGSQIYEFQKTDSVIKAIKICLNFHLKDSVRERVVDELYDLLGGRFSVDEYYCSIKELKSLQDDGHVIGAHTDGHYVLSTLSKTEQRNQMKRSIDFLLNCDLYTHNTLCFPHGRVYSINDDTIALCKELNLDYCFMVDPRDLSYSDLQDCRYRLPRYDCTDFDYGKSNYQK